MGFNSTPGNVTPADIVRVPTELFLTEQTSTENWNAQIVSRTGCKVSSAITSATLTEVLDIPGPGVLTFGGLITSSSPTSTSSKIQIEIDGANVTDESALNIVQTSFFGVAGSVYQAGSEITSTEVFIPFNSLRVLIAGDGSNGVQFAYKNYLT